MRAMMKLQDRFDFDVYLPLKKCNLQRDLCWTDIQKSQLIISLLKGNYIGNLTIIDNRINGKWGNYFPICFEDVEYYFSDLDDNCKSTLLSYSFKSTVYYSDDVVYMISDDEKIKIFIQVNYTGTPQESDYQQKLKNLLVIDK